MLLLAPSGDSHIITVALRGAARDNKEMDAHIKQAKGLEADCIPNPLNTDLLESACQKCD